MDLFLSWSGETSKAVALALREFLPTLFPDVSPWMSAEDITKGGYWNDALRAALGRSRVVVACMTSSNLDSPWIHFECGRIAQSEPRPAVVPLMFHLPLPAVSPPLSQFQGAPTTLAGITGLVRAINGARGAPVPDAHCERELQRRWPKLARRLEAIPNPGEALGRMLDPGADCYIVCPAVRQGKWGALPVAKRHRTPVVSFTDMEGVFSLITFLGHHGKRDRFCMDASGRRYLPQGAAGGILVGGPQTNVMTDELLPNLGRRFKFIYSRYNKRRPAKIRDNESKKDYQRFDSGDPDADYGLVVKSDDGNRTIIVLAGLGARSTRAACTYFVKDWDTELARRSSYECLIRSSLSDPLARPTIVAAS